MPDEFDPYLQWLGIRDEERPPNHYRLLGLESGTSDTAAIVTAAATTADKVKLFLQSRHAPRAQALLQEIKTAKAVLSDAQSRAQYDRQLAGPASSVAASATNTAPPPAARTRPPAAPAARAKPGPAKSAAPPRSTPPKATKRAPAPTPAPAIDVLGEQGGEEGGGSVHLRQPKRRSGTPWLLVAGGGIAAVVLIGLVAVVANSGGEEVAGPVEDPANKPLQMADAPGPTEPESPANEEEPEAGIDWGTLPRGADIAGRPTGDPAQGEPLTPLTEGEGVVDPSIPAVWVTGLPREEAAERPQALAEGNEKTLQAVRAGYVALAERNLELAQRELATARAAAQGGVDKQEVMRLETTVLLLTRFWDAVARQAETAAPGTKIHYGGSAYEGPEVTIVGQGGGMLRLRDANGWEHDFDLHPARIEAAVALALAERGLKSTGGAGLAAQGAFLALDREGDAAAAIRAWELAAAQAWPVDQFEPMMRYNYAALAVGMSPAWRDVEVVAEDPLAGGPPWPRPGSTDLLAARRELTERYSGDVAQATTRPQQAELAARLFAAGRAARTPALRYAYYFEAKRLAIEAIDTEQLFAVVDVIGAEFETDDRDGRLSALSQLTGGRLTGEEAALVMSFLDREIERLTQAEEFEDARLLTVAARGFARSRGGADGAAISDRLDIRLRWLRRLAEEQGPASEARERLSRFPDDSTANETLGWYTCVFLGDWERGLPHLAKSDNPQLSRRAEMDLENPTDPRTRFDVAKEWRELAEDYANDDDVEAVLLNRSVFWLTAAIPELPENLKPEAEALLTEINRTQSGGGVAPEGAVLANLLGRRWEIVFAPNPASTHPLADGYRYTSFEFYPDGTCRNNRYVGRWRLEGDLVVVEYEKKPSWRQVFGFTAQGLEVEHYDPADTLIVRGMGTVIP